MMLKFLYFSYKYGANIFYTYYTIITLFAGGFILSYRSMYRT